MKENRYYDFAENDYFFISSSLEKGFYASCLAVMCQQTCERFLKQIVVDHIAENKSNTEEYQNILKCHSITELADFIKKYLSDFDIPSVVTAADGFYGKTDYPGEGSFLATKEDIEACWEATKVCKSCVDKYIGSHSQITDGFGTQ